MAPWVFAFQVSGSEFRRAEPMHTQVQYCVSITSALHCDRDRKLFRNYQASKPDSCSHKPQDTCLKGDGREGPKPKALLGSPQVYGCMSVSTVTDMNTYAKIKRQKLYFNFLVLRA